MKIVPVGNHRMLLYKLTKNLENQTIYFSRDDSQDMEKLSVSNSRAEDKWRCSASPVSWKEKQADDSRALRDSMSTPPWLSLPANKHITCVLQE
jgi:hypothetical protein